MLIASTVAGCRSPAPPPAPVTRPATFLGVPSGFVPAVGREDGETPPLPARLSAEEAVRLALLGSPALRAARARVAVAAAASRQARLLPNPLLSASLRFTGGGGRPDLDLGIAQDLLAPFLRAPRTDAADARFRAALEEFVALALDVAAGTAEDCVHLLEARRRMDLLEERRSLLERMRDLARARLESGEGRPLDVTTVEEELAEAETDSAEAAGDLAAARLALLRSIGRPAETAPFELEPLPAPADPGAEADWIEAALERSPELQAMDGELAALQAEAREAGWAGAGGTEAGIDGESGSPWAIGPAVTVPLPLFDDGSARVEAARAAVEEARHRRAGEVHRIVGEVRTARARVVAALDALALARDRRLPLARRRRDEAEAVHRTGEADFGEVLLAERALLAARRSALEIETRAQVALIELHRAAGGGAREPATEAKQPTEGGVHHEDR